MGSFIEEFDKVCDLVYECNMKNGWLNRDRNKGELIALVHNELSEALEWLRKGNPESDHIQGFSGVEEEFADIIIRLMDMGFEEKFDIAGAILAKINYNKSRGYKHGDKLF